MCFRQGNTVRLRIMTIILTDECYQQCHLWLRTSRLFVNRQNDEDKRCFLIFVQLFIYLFFRRWESYLSTQLLIMEWIKLNQLTSTSLFHSMGTGAVLYFKASDKNSRALSIVDCHLTLFTLCLSYKERQNQLSGYASQNAVQISLAHCGQRLYGERAVPCRTEIHYCKCMIIILC